MRVTLPLVDQATEGRGATEFPLSTKPNHDSKAPRYGLRIHKVSTPSNTTDTSNHYYHPPFLLHRLCYPIDLCGEKEEPAGCGEQSDVAAGVDGEEREGEENRDQRLAESESKQKISLSQFLSCRLGKCGGWKMTRRAELKRPYRNRGCDQGRPSSLQHRRGPPSVHSHSNKMREHYHDDRLRTTSVQYPDTKQYVRTN